jgi:hypothetical protein
MKVNGSASYSGRFNPGIITRSTQWMEEICICNKSTLSSTSDISGSYGGEYDGGSEHL